MKENDREAMLPLSSLGILIIVLTGALIVHFNKLERYGSERAVSEISEAEMHYATAHTSVSVDEVARSAGERAVLRHSIASYEKPIDLDKWHGEGGNETYNEWRGALLKAIEEETVEEVATYFAGANTRMDGAWHTELDLNDFSYDDISLTASPDSAVKDSPSKLKIVLSFKEGAGIINTRDKVTGSTMSMKAGGGVSLAPRPFTLGEKAFNFSRTFRSRAESPLDPMAATSGADSDSADELAWYLWIVQELVGLTEANLKHEVRFATDERALYSMTQLFVAFKEMQHFGSFDYIHTAQEFSRPWIGGKGEEEDFTKILRKGIEGGHVEDLKKMLDAALFTDRAAGLSENISSTLILASSYLDSKTVSRSGRGFDEASVPEAISEHGVVEHLREARDVSVLESAAGKIDLIAMEVEAASDSVERGDVNEKGWLPTIGELKIEEEGGALYSEHAQFREEVELAQEDFAFSMEQLTRAHSGYEGLESYVNESAADNPVAELLWFGDASTIGLDKILPAKVDQTSALLSYYTNTLKTGLEAFHYGAFQEEKYQIDYYYSEAITSLQKAESELSKAKSAKAEYHTERYRFENCYTHLDSIDSAISGGCWSRGYSCSPYRCLPYACNCKTVCKSTKKGSHCYKSCDTCWSTCYHTCYDCSSTCRSDFASKMEAAAEEYRERMQEAAAWLKSSSGDVKHLKSSIDAFFEDKDVDEFYANVEAAHGMFRPPDNLAEPYSIMDIYYAHPALCNEFDLERPYESAYVVLNPEDVKGEDFSSGNYAISPEGPFAFSYSAEYQEFGHYYLGAVLDSLRAALNGDAVNKDLLSKAGDLLEELEGNGFLKCLLDILDLTAQARTAGTFPEGFDLGLDSKNTREHIYTTLPLPPISLEYEPLGIESKGISVVHDLRLRADTRPGELKIDTMIGSIGPLRLGADNALNPSFPVPFTPLNIYLWGFEVSPSRGKSGEHEGSFLWLIDFENNANVAPLVELERGQCAGPSLLKVHKPIMYKFTFTAFEEPNQVAKDASCNYLPPVFVISPAPFLTHFGEYMEPPDR